MTVVSTAWNDEQLELVHRQHRRLADKLHAWADGADYFFDDGYALTAKLGRLCSLVKEAKQRLKDERMEWVTRERVEAGLARVLELREAVRAAARLTRPPSPDELAGEL